MNAVLPQLSQRRRHADPGLHQDRDGFFAAAARGRAPHRKLVLQAVAQSLADVGVGHTGHEQVHRLIQPAEFDRPVISDHALAITQSFPPTTRMNGTMASSSVTPPCATVRCPSCTKALRSADNNGRKFSGSPRGFQEMAVANFAATLARRTASE